MRNLQSGGSGIGTTIDIADGATGTFIHGMDTTEVNVQVWLQDGSDLIDIATAVTTKVVDSNTVSVTNLIGDGVSHTFVVIVNR